MHVRTQIRNAIVARLQAQVPAVGANVFASRVYPVAETSLPCILVNTDEEAIDHTVGNVLARNLTLNLRIVTRKSGGGLDDELDSIAEDTEIALTDPGLIAGQYQCLITAVGFEFDGSAEQPAGVLTLTYRFDYFTPTAAPGSAL